MTHTCVYISYIHIYISVHIHIYICTHIICIYIHISYVYIYTYHIYIYIHIIYIYKHHIYIYTDISRYMFIQVYNKRASTSHLSIGKVSSISSEPSQADNVETRDNGSIIMSQPKFDARSGELLRRDIRKVHQT